MEIDVFVSRERGNTLTIDLCPHSDPWEGVDFHAILDMAATCIEHDYSGFVLCTSKITDTTKNLSS